MCDCKLQNQALIDYASMLPYMAPFNSGEYTTISAHWYGSRAYGLESRDSDYDIALIVAYPLHRYAGFQRITKQIQLKYIQYISKIGMCQINISILDVRNVIQNIARMDVHHYTVLDSVQVYNSGAGMLLLDYVDSIRDFDILTKRELNGISNTSIENNRALRHQYRAFQMFEKTHPRITEPVKVDQVLHLDTIERILNSSNINTFVEPDLEKADKAFVDILKLSHNDQFQI